jgi:transposase
MSSARSRWRSAIGSSRSISNRERIAARVPLCRKRSGRNGSRRRREISRSSTCAKGCFRLTGTDLTRIDSIDVMTATTIVNEAGYDMSKWETEHHFVSWLRLCPDNRISGAKVISKGRLPTNNPISIGLKMAASSLRLSDTYLGAQFRRLRTKLGAPVAIKAMAAKLARLVYRMLRYGMKYVDKGADFYQLQHRQLKVKQLKWKAASLGYQVIPIPAA